jgi:hypothetical protein
MNPPRRLLFPLALIGLVIVVGYTLWTVNTLADRLDSTIEQRDQSIQQLEDHGIKPTVTAEPGEPGPQGEQGIPGPAGRDAPPPTDVQVERAVAAFCADNNCRGQKGTDGESVTPEQVAAAVAGYCDANGECRGPAGEAGQQGEDSTVPGPQGVRGPGPTDEQVTAAVASYCVDGRCRGPAGADGRDGADGQDGRGISEVRVSRDGLTSCQLVIVYTDGAEDRYDLNPLMCT